MQNLKKLNKCIWCVKNCILQHLHNEFSQFTSASASNALFDENYSDFLFYFKISFHFFLHEWTDSDSRMTWHGFLHSIPYAIHNVFIFQYFSIWVIIRIFMIAIFFCRVFLEFVAVCSKSCSELQNFWGSGVQIKHPFQQVRFGLCGWN